MQLLKAILLIAGAFASAPLLVAGASGGPICDVICGSRSINSSTCQKILAVRPIPMNIDAKTVGKPTVLYYAFDAAHSTHSSAAIHWDRRQIYVRTDDGPGGDYVFAFNWGIGTTRFRLSTGSSGCFFDLPNYITKATSVTVAKIPAGL